MCYTVPGFGRSLFVCALWLVLPTYYAVAQGQQEEQPNIVLIMADDLGREVLSAYGGTSYETPHLDRLATTGMRFEHAYAQPLCTPSRVQIMTGQYNFRNYERFGYLNPEETTFAHVLQDASYATAIAGKWQLGGDRGTPHTLGFDEYLLWQVREGDYWYRYKHPIVTGSRRARDTLRGAYGPDVFAAFIEGFIERHQDQPFFVYYPMVLTHKPFQPTPDLNLFKTYDVVGFRDTTYFPAMVAYMDQIVGRIVEKLEALDLRENTLVLFTGDNGTARNITSRFGRRIIRGDKGYTTEAGTHVPLIANWPGTIRPGVSSALIDFTDFLPTLAEVAGVELEDGSTDGISFYGSLMGRPERLRTWIFCDYDAKGRDFPVRRYAQDARYKLYADGRFYNIASDPKEEHPLQPGEQSAEAVQAKVKLRGALEIMQREIQRSKN